MFKSNATKPQSDIACNATFLIARRPCKITLNEGTVLDLTQPGIGAMPINRPLWSASFTSTHVFLTANSVQAVEGQIDWMIVNGKTTQGGYERVSSCISKRALAFSVLAAAAVGYAANTEEEK